MGVIAIPSIPTPKAVVSILPVNAPPVSHRGIEGIVNRLRPLVLLDESVDEVDLLSVDSSRAVFQIETDQTSILEPFLSAGVPLETPIHITDRVAEWTFTTSQNRLSVLSTQLQASDLTYEVARIGADGTSSESKEQRPTDRQREVFTAAHDVGYFEVPKNATIEAVTREAEVSKSTANEIVRRAVRNLADWYVTTI